MKEKIRISETGYSNGWGCSPWKTVHGLTAEERAAVRAGEIVLITGCPKSGGGNGTGTTVRQLRAYAGKIYHFVPSDEVSSQAGIEE